MVYETLKFRQLRQSYDNIMRARLRLFDKSYMRKVPQRRYTMGLSIPTTYLSRCQVLYCSQASRARFAHVH